MSIRVDLVLRVLIGIATTYFTRRAASWLQSSRAHSHYPIWETFCEVVTSKFDKNEHQNLIRQTDLIKQTSTLNEYYERFDELMHQLLAHDLAINPLYFSTKFCEGLKDEICIAVLVQRPVELETALAIAILQEEVTDTGRRRDPRRPSSIGCSNTRPDYPAAATS
jgi:hypothetical protein